MLHIITKRVPLRGTMIITQRMFGAQTSNGAASQPAVNINVQGLSENCVKVPNTPVGPNAAKQEEYKNPEYFCYHVDTIGEAEVELEKYRLPVPSNRR
ncbi:PREDICTED: uncharacterized protein LOC106745248 [Dinoponera quadriceps]|uniref:Uncharacterized protein LOC106745248 n=1 Tax=Dinoponera quadriceps TaxID=609295 RepID=A0A6P3XD81_DINQU|nr:PREDICTED: uncharacterized protein LOC106745248 [Dinoponera quadriceps]